MNERIEELFGKALDRAVPETWTSLAPDQLAKVTEEFAKLIVEEVLDQVKERAYYTGDRDWSDEIDRPWIQLEFGYGELHNAKHHTGKWIKK